MPPERVASVTDCKPVECRRCGHSLSGEDAEPRRHQVAELPPIEPEVHEYRVHRLCCPHCHAVTSGTLPEGVPGTAFGPRRRAALCVLTGAYRLSKRRVAQLCSDLLGLTISLGMIAELERITADVLGQPVAELAEAVKTAEAANIDETGWREGGRKAWLWVVVAAAGVVFRVVVRSSLESGAACACPKTATTCAELLRLWDCLWTFTRVEGVEPTNNAAERALRHAVIWRRISGGTDSEAGSRFVERMLSAVATCRRRNCGVLGFLTACLRARLDGTPAPSLLAGT